MQWIWLNWSAIEHTAPIHKYTVRSVMNIFWYLLNTYFITQINSPLSSIEFVPILYTVIIYNYVFDAMLRFWRYVVWVPVNEFWRLLLPKYLNERNRSFVSPKVKREGHFNLSVQPIVIGRSVTFLERRLYAQTDAISFCAQGNAPLQVPTVLLPV